MKLPRLFSGMAVVFALSGFFYFSTASEANAVELSCTNTECFGAAACHYRLGWYCFFPEGEECDDDQCGK